MDQKEFKESLIEGIKENFDERGVEGMSFNDRGGVDKLNGGYDGVVITPEGSNIGVTLNVDALFEFLTKRLRICRWFTASSLEVMTMAERQCLLPTR